MPLNPLPGSVAGGIIRWSRTVAGRRDRPPDRQRPIRAQRVACAKTRNRVECMATGAETVFRAA